MLPGLVTHSRALFEFFSGLVGSSGQQGSRACDLAVIAFGFHRSCTLRRETPNLYAPACAGVRPEDKGPSARNVPCSTTQRGTPGGPSFLSEEMNAQAEAVRLQREGC